MVKDEVFCHGFAPNQFMSGGCSEHVQGLGAEIGFEVVPLNG
jgi:hypothetical protein